MRDTQKPISVITRLMDTAIVAGEQGLLQRDSQSTQKFTTGMVNTYEAALSRSLKVSLTILECRSFDEQSHQVELLRVKLETLTFELRRHEKSASRRVAPPTIPEMVGKFIESCNQQRRITRSMLRVNSTLTKQ